MHRPTYLPPSRCKCVCEMRVFAEGGTSKLSVVLHSSEQASVVCLLRVGILYRAVCDFISYVNACEQLFYVGLFFAFFLVSDLQLYGKKILFVMFRTAHRTHAEIVLHKGIWWIVDVPAMLQEQ